MALYSIPNLGGPAASGSALGGALGTGLSSLIGDLAQSKAKELHQKRNESRFISAGYSPEQASVLSMLEGSPLAKLLMGATPQGSQGQQQYQPQQMNTQEFQQPQRQENVLEQLQQVLSSPYEASQLINQTALGQPGAQKDQRPPVEQQLQKLPQRSTAQAKKPLFIDKAQELAERKVAAAERKADALERKQAFKETKEERKEIISKARQAREELRDLDRLEELEKEGKLNEAGYEEALRGAGLDIPALKSPESEEFQKISANFIRNAKNIFGARISNFEVEQFLKTIPTLSQSPEGRKRVISNMKRIARTNLAYNDAYKDIINKNKGIPPIDLLEQIDDKIEPLLDKVSKQFKEDLKRSVPESPSKLKTAALAAAGKAAPSVAGTLIGAGLGSVIPGVGTALGAAGGAAAGLAGPLLGKFFSK